MSIFREAIVVIVSLDTLAVNVNQVRANNYLFHLRLFYDMISLFYRV